MGANKLSVWDVVSGSGPEAVAAVDRLGYRFLAEQGYIGAIAAGAEHVQRALAEAGQPKAAQRMSSTARDAIRKEMSKRGERLVIHGTFDGDKGVYSVFFTLRKGNRRIIATSDAVRLQGVAMDAPVAYDSEEEGT